MNIKCMRTVLVLFLVLTPSATSLAAEQSLYGTFDARDTLQIAPDASKDAQEMLDELAWKGETFKVVCRAEEEDQADALVTHNTRHFAAASIRFGLRTVSPAEVLSEVEE